MKKITIISILLFSITLFSFGQDKAADAKKLITLMQSEKMIDGMMDNMIPMLKQQANMQITGADAKEKFDKYVDFLMTETKELTKKIVNEEMVRLYETHFTHSEIKDMIAFYESPTGKKMLEKTPELTTDLMNVMMTKYMPEFQQKIGSRLEELK